MNLRKATLVYPSRLARFLRLQPPLRVRQSAQWIYLGRDSEQASRWKDHFGGRAALDLGNRFRQISLENRIHFLDWIAAIGNQESDSLLWYTSRVSEKNPLVDRLYYRSCLHRLGAQVLAEERGLAVVCEDSAVFRSLRDLFPQAATFWPFVAEPGFVEWGTAKAKFIVKAAAHLLRSWKDRRRAQLALRRVPSLGAPLFAPPERMDPGSKTVLIHSCMDPSYLATGQDRYLTTLPEDLRQQGHRVLLMPWIYRDGGERERFYANFESHPEEVMLPDLFYELKDYFWSLVQVWRLGAIPKIAPSYAGHPSTHWIRASKLQQSHDVGLALFFRHYRLPQRLKQAGARCDIYIDTFENMVTEKPMILGLRKSAPEVKTVGYQHWASPAPLMLCNFLSRQDVRNPLPDKIVTYSDFTRDIMIREGYSADLLVVGPSLRYAKPPLSPPHPTDRRIGLIVLPLEGQQAIATLINYRSGIELCSPRIRNRIHTRIKPHPMTTPAEWERIIEAASFPRAQFEKVEGTLYSQLEAAHFGVTAASTAAIEIALSGRPLIQLSLWMDLELDSLAWFADKFPIVMNPQDLAEALTRICKADAEFFSQTRALACGLYESCISEANPSEVGCFVD